MRRLLAPATLVATLSLALPAFGASADTDASPKAGSTPQASSAVKTAGKAASGASAQNDGHDTGVAPASKVKIIKRLGPKSAAAAQSAPPHDSKPASADDPESAHAADTPVSAGKPAAEPKASKAKKGSHAPAGDHAPASVAAHAAQESHPAPEEKASAEGAAHADDHVTPGHDAKPTAAASRRARRSGKSATPAGEGAHRDGPREEAKHGTGDHDTEAGASLRAARVAKRAASKAPAVGHAEAAAPVAAVTAATSSAANAHARDAHAPVASPRPPPIARRSPTASAVRATPPPARKPSTPWRELEWRDSWVALDWDAARWVALSWDADTVKSGSELAGVAPLPAPRPPTQQ